MDLAGVLVEALGDLHGAEALVSEVEDPLHEGVGGLSGVIRFGGLCRGGQIEPGVGFVEELLHALGLGVEAGREFIDEFRGLGHEALKVVDALGVVGLLGSSGLATESPGEEDDAPEHEEDGDDLSD